MSENNKTIATNVVLIYVLALIGGVLIFASFIANWEFPSDDNLDEYMNFTNELNVAFIISQFLIAMSIGLFAILNYLKPNTIEYISK